MRKPTLNDIGIINNRFEHLIHEVKRTKSLLEAVISDANYKKQHNICFTKIVDLVKQKQKILTQQLFLLNK